VGVVRVCGVDDAGRGPVIGPLVIAGVIIEEEKLDRLKMLGVKDSKQLLASARTRLSKEIPSVVDDYHVVELVSKVESAGSQGDGAGHREVETRVSVCRLVRYSDRTLQEQHT